MAIMKLSGIGIVGLSGKIQGTVLLVNNVARVWHKTKTVKDSATNMVKGIFSGISAAYKTLTPTELLSWANAVPNYLRKNALAEVRTLTANQAFQRVNNILISLGFTPRTTAPGVAITDTITEIDPAAAAGAATFTVDVTTFNAATVLSAGEFIKVYATPQYTASKQKFSKSNFRYIGSFPSGTAINPLDIEAGYVAKVGALVAGQRIGVALEWIYATPATAANFKQNQRIYGDCVVAA